MNRFAMKKTFLFLLVAAVSVDTVFTQESVNDFGLLHWLISNGGEFNTKQELRYDEASHLAIFAKEPIEEGEVLAKIPMELFLGPESVDDEVDDNDDFFCILVTIVAEEMERGADSFYAPYVQYLYFLLESGPTIPSAWSKLGKALLMEMLGGDEQSVPPGAAVTLLDDAWFDECKGTAELESVAGLVKQKSDGDFMIPIFDLYTHRNGKYYNVKTKYENGNFVQVSARRSISAGEQLHNSFDLCDDCNLELVEMGYGTPGRTFKRMKVLVCLM
jgi:SET domain